MGYFTNQQEYNDKMTEVARLAVAYTNTDKGYYQMRNAFSELCEKSGANKNINHEATIDRRRLLVQSICIKTIPSLSSEANSRLESQLMDIAEDYEERNIHRMRR